VIVGAVVAAGAGRRMGRPKGEVVLDGLRLVDRAVAALRDGGCDRVLAVVRPGVAVAGAEAIENPDPDRGLRSSVELALAAAGEGAALMVLPVDMPGVGAAAVHAVAQRWRPGRVAMARYPAGGGHPVLMGVQLWRQALAGAGPDEGARRFLADHPHLVDLVATDGDPSDLDTPADLL
jgi:CTP:molybdopterin cytidylyltransferase MocA